MDGNRQNVRAVPNLEARSLTHGPMTRQCDSSRTHFLLLWNEHKKDLLCENLYSKKKKKKWKQSTVAAWGGIFSDH